MLLVSGCNIWLEVHLILNHHKIKPAQQKLYEPSPLRPDSTHNTVSKLSYPPPYDSSDINRGPSEYQVVAKSVSSSIINFVQQNAKQQNMENHPNARNKGINFFSRT